MRAAALAMLLLAVGLGDSALARVHTVIVTGLGGEDIYEARFEGWARGLRDAAQTRFGGPEGNTVWLSGSNQSDADGPARLPAVLDAITAAFARSGPEELVLLVLIGHGTAQAGDVAFNLPGADLRPEALAEHLATLDERRLLVVNTSSASGPFMAPLAGPRRILVSATSNAAELHVTRFGGFFVEALVDDAADADKDGRLSVLEAFEYARSAVARSFQDERLLRTENALLDDNGDGVGALQPAQSETDGPVARSLFLVDASPGSSGPRALALVVAARRLVAEVETLKARRAVLREAEYDERLEALLVELALNRRSLREQVTP